MQKVHFYKQKLLLSKRTFRYAGLPFGRGIIKLFNPYSLELTG